MLRTCPTCRQPVDTTDTFCPWCFIRLPPTPLAEHTSASAGLRIGHCEFHPYQRAFMRCDCCHKWLCADCEIAVLGHCFCSKCVYLYQDLPVLFRELEQENKKKIRLAQERERINGELRIARQMQARLLPYTPPSLANVEIAARSVPCKEVGGDYYDYKALSNGHLAICIGDVTGEGVPAALLMAMVKSCLFTLLAEGRRPAEITDWLDSMVRVFADQNQLMTFLYGVLDPQQGTFHFCNAGHLYPCQLKVATGQIHFLEAEGLPLGAALTPYLEREYILEIGDTIVLFTDGLVEARNRYGEMYGFERLQQVLKRDCGKDCQTVIQSLFVSAERFLNGADMADDTTVMALRLLPSSNGDTNG